MYAGIDSELGGRQTDSKLGHTTRDPVRLDAAAVAILCAFATKVSTMLYDQVLYSFSD